ALATGYGGNIQLEQTAGAMLFQTANTVTGQGTAQTMNEQMRITNGGSVGIGTTTPNRKLEIAGSGRVQPSALPATAYAGDLAFDSSAANVLKYYNGSGWVSVTASASPVGTANAIQATNGTTSFISNNNVVIDTTNGRIGIGTNAPAQK